MNVSSPFDERTPCPTVFDTLLEPVRNYVEQQEQERSHHHNETFTYLAFFRLLAYYYVSGIQSIALLINTYLKKGLLDSSLNLSYVPRTTFNEGFERFSPDMFRDVFVFLLSSLSLQVVPELATLGVFYCVDGSLFPTVCSMSWAEYRSNTQALKLHLCFELNRMMPVDFLVGSGKSSERAALRQMLTDGVTYIADRGYVCFQLFDDVLTSKAHLIFRMKANLKYQVQTVLDANIPVSALTLFRNVTDQLIICDNDPHKHLYRLVCFRVGPAHVLLLTDRRDLTTFQVMLLYAYRWQVELIFRFLKRTMNGLHLISNNKDGVTIQFYMLLIVSLLQLHLKQQAVGHTERTSEVLAQEAQPHQDSTASQEATPPQDNIHAQEHTRPPELKPTEIFHDVRLQDNFSHPYHFFQMIGEKLKKYWKIGIHWLSILRSILAQPFNERALELLGSG